MIFEFAIEPEFVLALAKRDRLDFLYEGFGMKEGRVIADLPQDEWLNKTWALVGGEEALDDVDRKALEETLKSLDERRILLSRPADWSEAEPWLDNALRADAADPFQAILARKCPEGCDRVVDEPVRAGRTHPLLKVSKERRIERTPRELARCIEPMLRLAAEIYLIDPHWDPGKERFGTTFRAFLGAALRRNKRAAPRMIEIHRRLYYNETTGPTRAESLRAWSDIKRLCERSYPPILPPDTALKLVLWEAPASCFHDRYVLTEFGGVNFSVGLDADSTGGAGAASRTHVARLSEQDYSDLWQEFLGGSPLHTRVDQVEFKGVASAAARPHR